MLQKPTPPTQPIPSPSPSQQNFRTRTEMREQKAPNAPENTLVNNSHIDEGGRDRSGYPLQDEIREDDGEGQARVKRVKMKETEIDQFPEIGQEMDNLLLTRNTFVFGIFMVLTQIGVSLVYAFKFNTVDLDPVWRANNQITLAPLFINILILFIALLGFTMLFSYNKKLIWTALTFNFFLTCLTLQLYFITNNLITRIGLTPALQNSPHSWHIYLWNFDYHYREGLTDGYYQVYGNTLIDGVKAAICNVVVYSAVLGRAGLLEGFFVGFGGTVGYQFVRQILGSLGIDFGDGCAMWVFGGFCGAAIGLVEFVKNRRKVMTSTKKCLLYTGGLYSTAFSIMGCTVLIILLPLLASHGSRSQYSLFPGILQTIPYTIYHSTASSIMLSIGTSILLNGKLQIRDFINGAIAGAIASFNPSFYIVMPAYAQVVGVTAGLLQVLVQNFVENRFAMDYEIMHSYSFCLFGLQGLLGAGFGSLFRIALKGNQYGFGPEYKALLAQEAASPTTQPIVLALIAAGLGIGFGLAIGLFIAITGSHRKYDNFQDKSYFSDPEEQPFRQWQSQIMQKMMAQDLYKPNLLPLE